MKQRIIALFCATVIVASCSSGKKEEKNMDSTRSLSGLLQQYYEERMQLLPFEATANGENRYNDQFPIDISDEYRAKLGAFYDKYLALLDSTGRDGLNENDQISYDILKWEMEISKEGLAMKDQLTPINQFWSMTLSFAQFGSGESIQPFKTVKDYDNFLARMSRFPLWCDTAIANMKQGVEEGITNPKILMERVVPQLKSMQTDVKESVFYMPVKKFPESFSAEDKKRLEEAYSKAIAEQIIPAYTRVYEYIKNEYIPKCRTSVGISAVPGGSERYKYLAKYWTTTTIDPDSIFNLGMSEVHRLRTEMEKIKDETGYKGDLKSFFKYLNTDKKFFPFKKPEEVIAAFNNIHDRMKPQLNKLFDKAPRSKFEVRQTEKFREASASAEYQQGTADGSRPGIFYTPIPDATKFNTFGMEDLFLHEAIPGHHYQNMLTIENDSLPMFRRYIWYGAYGEGWALYTESLGDELGLYKDPYQKFASLSEEMHRAIRLVVDVGMHMKGWTREQAIAFSLENEGEDEKSITSEIERYMAIPGQALSYKIGQLKIRELRHKAETELGDKFDIKKFHDEILKDGCLPLAVLEAKINRWIESGKQEISSK